MFTNNLPEDRHWYEKAWHSFLQSPHRKGITIAAVAVFVPIVAALLVGAAYYHRCARLIDAKIEGGPFRNSVNIYGAPIVLSEGDAAKLSDIQAELRLAGYRPSSGGKPGSFAPKNGGIEVVPASGPPVEISVVGKMETLQIRSEGRDLKMWTAGYPLLENLSPGMEKRQMVTFRELPPVLVNAVTSVEDRHFFHHSGLDLPRVAKAAYVDVKDRKKEQGASTLTMQLVRGLWLEPEKRWSRKISEAMMTVHLEHQWTKEEIFAAYANQVFLGRQAAYSINGFAEASRLFFGKGVGDLNLPEAALLAGMVQRPSYFNPYRNPEHAKARRDIVLALMRDNKYITKAQYAEATATPIHVVSPAEHNDPMGAAYFLDMVRTDLAGEQEEDGTQLNQAKKVYTTIDLALQQAAEEAVQSGMSSVDKLLARKYQKGARHAEVALIAMDPHTGEVKAVVGGRDYAHSQLNRVFAKRPPGSVFKPFVYAAAMNTGIDGRDNVLTTATTIDDEQADFGNGGSTYRPANFKQETFGTLTLQQALAKSDNVVAVKLGEMVGFPAVVAMAKRAGLNDDIQPTPSVALGSYEVTPIEMAGAYTVFANAGTWVKPRIISQVQDEDGASIRGEHGQTHRALDSRVAFLMSSMLEEVMRTGTAAGVRSRGFTVPAAGKTGTAHDGWFAGYTSQLLCIVWVGFDDYQELDLEGAKSALPIWTEFMKKAGHQGAYRNAHEFSKPNGVESAKICLESGKLAGDLCTKTATQYFIDGTEPRDPCDVHTGITPPVADNSDLRAPDSVAAALIFPKLVQSSR